MKRISIVAVAVFALASLISCSKNENDAHKYQLISDESIVKWKGFLRTGYFNEGSISVQSRNLELVDGEVRRGTFVMPLASLENFNLPTEELKTELIHHLQSDDFFHMIVHPTVSFTIEQVKYHSDNDPESVENANFLVSGQLTILGKALPVSFPARIEEIDGELLIAAKLKIDRTRWGMNFAADPALPDDKYILPEIAIEFDLKAERR